jgi:endogenous inhibitor of DNA gyrase (YacG/DUF329 family)
VTGEGRIKRPVHPCPRCGEPVPVKVNGRPAKWCSQKCRRAAYEERRAAARGAIAVEVVERVQYVEHDLDQCLTEVLTSPLASRRAVYRWRQMLRDGELHRDGWRDIIAPLLGLAEAINSRAKGDGRERIHLPHDHGRPRRADEFTFSRDQFAREIRWLVSQADADPWEWERQNLREFLRALAAVLPQMEKYYEARRMHVPFNQLVIVADAIHWARAQ